MSVILMEFNELSPIVIRQLMAEGELPNFSRLHRESDVYETEADELSPNLEPWIQWVTVHSGMPFADHGIERLGDGHQLDKPNLWDLVSDEGGSVWVCGSMNITYRTPINGWVLPDPWVTHVRPHPEQELEPYYRFVAENVQEHTRENGGGGRSDAIAFVRFMVRHGMSPATAGAIARQIISERASDTGWKRPVILDRLQYDLFRWYWKRHRPDFSTFFLNSTAHYQHIYWRHMDPEKFEVAPDPDELQTYEDAIPFGYREMDRLCGRLMDLADEDTTLVLLTALSQEPCLKYEDVGGKKMYRPHDFIEFARRVGIDGDVEASPVMAEEFHLDFGSEEDARAAAAKLEQVRYRGEPALRFDLRGSNVFAACTIVEQVPQDAELELDGSPRSIPFYELFYQLDLVKSGIHHPDGLMWIRRPERTHAVHDEKVPLVDVAPTMLGLMGIEPPAHMPGKRLEPAAAVTA